MVGPPPPRIGAGTLRARPRNEVSTGPRMLVVAAVAVHDEPFPWSRRRKPSRSRRERRLYSIATQHRHIGAWPPEREHPLREQHIVVVLFSSMCSRIIFAICAEIANRRQSPFLAFGWTTHPACPSGWFSDVTYDADRVMLIIVVDPNSKSHGRFLYLALACPGGDVQSRVSHCGVERNSSRFDW